jgi:hypothetical protein
VKKKSINNDDPSINFKLPMELREQVVREAELLNSTVSNYLRNHLIEFLSGKLFEKEMAFYKSQEFLNTTEFLQLVAWVFAQRKNDKCIATEAQLNSYKQTLKKLEGNVPDSLVLEFDKVLIDLLRFQADRSSSRAFIFGGNSYTNPLFDYGKLERFLLNEINSDLP